MTSILGTEFDGETATDSHSEHVAIELDKRQQGLVLFAVLTALIAVVASMSGLNVASDAFNGAWADIIYPLMERRFEKPVYSVTEY